MAKLNKLKKDGTPKKPPPPQSLENLKKWKPGQSGNPTGRPKRQPITQAYIDLADKVFNSKTARRRPNSTFAEAVAFSIFAKAIKSGDATTIREIREAIEGKSPQRIEHTGADGKDLTPPQQQKVIVEFVDVVRDPADTAAKGADEPASDTGSPGL